MAHTSQDPGELGCGRVIEAGRPGSALKVVGLPNLNVRDGVPTPQRRNQRRAPFQFFTQTIVVLASSSDTNGALGAIEVASPGAAVPPLHVHHRANG